MKAITTLLIGAMLVTGCARLAESRLNPLNWFGRAERVATTPDRSELRPLVPPGARAAAQDSRPLIASITTLAIEPTLQGAIIRAEGQAASGGWFNAELVAVDLTDGVLTYEFRATPPVSATGGTTTITAATTLTRTQLAGVRTIRVIGATDALSASR
jgi:hypothetical protein